jgi:hypothetical protein
MNTVPSNDSQEIPDGVIQLRFSDNEGDVKDIIAAELVEVLQGIIEFTSDMAKKGLFGDGVEPEVRVRPPKEGSFIVEAVVTWLGENPEAALGLAMTAGGAVTQALRVGFRKLRGEEPSDFEEISDGSIKVKWPDNKVDHVPRQVWNRLNEMKRPTRAALRKILTPLGDDVDVLEVRDGSVNESTSELLQAAPGAVAERSDYRAAAPDPDEIVEEITTFETEARLQSIDFRPGEKWRVQTITGTRLASMKDDSFLLEIDRGAPLHKNDIFELTIQELRTTKNERVSTEWSIVNVVRKRRGEDDGAST